jgi:hypothetical protein
MARRKKSEQANTAAATSPNAAQAPADTQLVKRGPGRPRKTEVTATPAAAKRGPGRPRKAESAAPAAKKPGRRGRPRKAVSPSIGQQIDDLIRQLQSIKDQIGKMEASAGKLDRVLTALKS